MQIEAVMLDVQAAWSRGIITHSATPAGAPDLGMNGTPEVWAPGRLFGRESVGTRQQAKRDRQEQVSVMLSNWDL
jgi:hypothetical protein